MADTEAMFRRSVVALTAAGAAVALGAACDAFDSDERPGSGVDGGSSLEAGPAESGAAPSDGGSPVQCEPEPPWVDERSVADGGLSTATCDGVAGVDLLNSDSHCGRCSHSCLGDGCDKGRCKPKPAATGESGTGLRRLGGGLVFVSGDVIRAVAPPASPTTLATAPGASSLRSAVYDDTSVFTRGYLRLFRIGRDGGAVDTLSVATAGTAPVFLSPAGDVVFDSDNGYLRASKLGDGGDVAPFGPRNVSAAAEVVGGLVLLANAWSDGSPPRTATIHYEPWVGGTTLILGTAANLAAIAVDAEHVYAVRVDGAKSGIVRTKLPPRHDAVVEEFVGDPKLVVPGGRFVATDDTHVYWTRPSGASNVDVVKRAKCGGAAVVVARDVAPGPLVPLGEYLYRGSSGVPRIAK